MTKPNLNVTPLIDVLLVLLIIFMVISPPKPAAFKAKVPAKSTDTSRLPPNPESLIVTVNPDHSLKLNRQNNFGTVEEPTKLITALQSEFKKREADRDLRPGSNETEKTVFIEAPKNLDYGSVTRVVDAVKTSGAEPIGLQIDSRE